MRDILFRGKRVDNGRWIHGDYVGGYFICDDLEDTEYVGFVEINPETVGQYTGLTDKNGKKIFEGDILQFEAYGHLYTGFVEYGNAEFGVDCKTASPFLSTAVVRHDAVVIGNIHDNPELLGGADCAE